MADLIVTVTHTIHELFSATDFVFTESGGLPVDRLMIEHR